MFQIYEYNIQEFKAGISPPRPSGPPRRERTNQASSPDILAKGPRNITLVPNYHMMVVLVRPHLPLTKGVEPLHYR